MLRIRRIVEIYSQKGIVGLSKDIISNINHRIPKKPLVSQSPTPRVIYILIKWLVNFAFTVRFGEGTDVMSQDWDTLIILDACRFDDFEQYNHIPGDLDYVISQGVDSPEFIQRNFLDKQFPDTVYVTANPHVHLIGDDVFHNIISDPISNWNHELNCVEPSDVATAAIHAHERYPNKRIIVHFMQPHDPPLGETGMELRSKYKISGPQSTDNRIMQLVAEEVISEQKARKAYRETLSIVLNEVDDMLSSIDGKVVVTSDHGEMFGKDPYPLLGKLYEHYRNPRTVELCRVPWLIVDSCSERRDIISGSTESEAESASVTKDSRVVEQLESLGYK